MYAPLGSNPLVEEMQLREAVEHGQLEEDAQYVHRRRTNIRAFVDEFLPPDLRFLTDQDLDVICTFAYLSSPPLLKQLSKDFFSRVLHKPRLARFFLMCCANARGYCKLERDIGPEASLQEWLEVLL